MWSDLVFGRDVPAIRSALASVEDRNPLIDDGRTALALAAACGYDEVVSALLDGGTNIEKPNGDDLAYTPLIEAAREGKRATVILLVERGASLAAGDSRAGAPLLHACINADAETAGLLLDRGAPVDGADDRGQTALHHLAQNAKSWGSGKITETVNGVTRELENPRYGQHLAVVKLLLARGASPNLETAYGYSAMHSAAQGDSPEILAMCLAHGGDANHANGKAYTALHAAADAGSTACVRVLVDAGANVNAADSSGFTPLIGATLAGSVETITLLLARGANPALAATEGYDRVAAGDTARDVARKLERPDLVALFA